MDAPFIRDSTFNEICRAETEGLVLLGAGGDPTQWIHGVLGMWKEQGISTSATPEEVLESALLLKSTGGRRDIALVLKAGTVNMPRMAMWRLRFGDCSWLSDFAENYKSHYESF